MRSGYIAGDALMGVLATFLIYIGTGVDTWISGTDNAWVSFAFFLLCHRLFLL